MQLLCEVLWTAAKGVSLSTVPELKVELQNRSCHRHLTEIFFWQFEVLCSSDESDVCMFKILLLVGEPITLVLILMIDCINGSLAAGLVKDRPHFQEQLISR